MSDTVEFFLRDQPQPFLVVDSAFQPNDGDLVNIRKVTYRVLGRSFTVDYADQPRRRQMRCVVIVEPYLGEQVGT